jgi:purine catabolism regulator
VNVASRPAAPLTLAECLAIPPLSAAEVVAGGFGVNRTVRWVHVVDVPNVEECLVGGELVMTSGISLGHDQGHQRRIVPVMEEMDLAGLVVAIGPYVDRVPPVILEMADERGIPVMALPWEVNFRDVLQSVLTAIVDRQHAMLELSAQIHRSLTTLVLEGGDLGDLTERLTVLLDRESFVLDPSFQVVAGGPGRDGPPTPAPRVPEPTRRLRAHRQAAGAPPLEPRVISEAGLDGLLAPVVVERRLHGYLWIDGAGRPFSDLDIVAVEHGATVAALVSYKDDAVLQAEQRHERGVLDLLLDGTPSSADPRFDAARVLPPDATYAVMIVELPGYDPARAEHVAERAVRPVAPAARARWRGNRLVVIVPGQPHPPLDDVLDRLRSAFAESEAPRIGVSQPSLGVSSIGKAYREAGEALRLVPLVDASCRVCRAETVRTLRLVADRSAAADGGRLAIAQLADHDAAHGTELLATLDAYLQQDGNASTTARLLGIHRHTLLNRVERIVALLGVELTPATRLDLRLQLFLHGLRHRG